MSKTFHLLIDATVEYCQLQRPSFSQRMQMQDLILAYIDNLPSSDLKLISHHLASCEHAPKQVLLELCKQEANICRPILLTSHVLQDSDLMGIIDGEDRIEHARIVARRLDLSPELSSTLRSFDDFKVDRALDLRQRPLVQSMDNDTYAKSGFNDEADSAFMQLCAEPNDAIIHTAFADRLGLQLTSCEILCNDLTSRNLPTAMKYIGLSETTAWAVYGRLAKETAKQPRVANAFKATYNCLTREQCMLIVGDWRMDELVMTSRMNSAANQPLPTANDTQKTA